MNCANSLLRDHDDIAAIVRVLDASVWRLRQHQYVDPAMLTGLDRFLRQFVVECHFRKEDAVFFPHVRAVLPDETARTFTCTALHGECLVPVQACHAAVDRMYADGTERFAGELAAAAAPCVDRLTAHIEAERPLLERYRHRPPDSEDEQLLHAFTELERRHLGPTGREWYAQLVADYADIIRTWR